MERRNLEGLRFGRWLVLQEAGGKFTKKGRFVPYCLCRCDCGTLKHVCSWNLATGKTISCGCYGNSFHIKHGKSRNNIYRIWFGIKERCLNKKRHEYYYYGGRGITICDEWLNFENFYRDMGERPSENHSVDRVDNSKGYCKENCRWATKKEQMNNTRKSKIVEYKGVSKTIAEWEDHLSIRKGTLRTRINRGWDIERAFEENIHIKNVL